MMPNRFDPDRSATIAMVLIDARIEAFCARDVDGVGRHRNDQQHDFGAAQWPADHGRLGNSLWLARGSSSSMMRERGMNGAGGGT